MMRPARLIVVVVALCAALAYLRDPPWLIGMDSGFRPWEIRADGARVRWTGGHASFFVPSNAAGITVPMRTPFASPPAHPVTVTLAIDDRTAGGLVLDDGSWHEMAVSLTQPGRRRLRRIDIRVDRTGPGNRGVEVGEVRLR